MSRTRSIINEIPGLPMHHGSDEHAESFGKRRYILTSWNMKGIIAGLQKFSDNGCNVTKDELFDLHTHYGMEGEGDEWFSCMLAFNAEKMEELKGERISDRYDLRRWVWTE